MPRLTKHYVVQPYWRSPKGLAAGTASRYPTEGAARAYAQGLMPTYQGVHVLSVEVEETLDFCTDPELVATYGDTPDTVI